MAKNERYVITTEINGQQAIDMLDKLTKKVERLEKAKKDALSLGHTSWIEGLDKKLKSASREMERFRQQTMSVNDILANLPSASMEQINKAMRSLRMQMKGLPSDSVEFKALNSQLEQCKIRLAEIKAEGKSAAEGFADAHDRAQFLYQVLHNLEHTSLNDLNRAAALLRENMAGLDPSTGPWQSMNQHLVMIEGRITAINAQQKQLVSTIDRYDKEIQEANKSIEVTKRETELVNKTMANISSANIRDVEYSIKILNEQMRGIPRGTAKFREMEQQVKKLRTELEKTRYEGKAQQGWLSRTADFFNKLQGSFIIIITMFTQLRFRLQQCIADFAQMEEEMANVRKYTGQTTEEVREMNEEFKKIDTRTPRERLNQLAGDAGRLGIKGKQGIMDFVDAADKINVSLGDDLGENAVKNIGKLAQTFGEDKRLGLRGAMLATGSAINELSQNSSAAAGYLVDFTARMAGVSNQAEITQTAIMGYASVLDENMLRDETASTALTNFINKMFTDTEKFANMAGMKVKDFSDLLRTDANQAVITFLKAMKQKGGFAELAPLLNDMHLSGQRAVSVLTVLANRVDDVQERQKLANVEYQKATSILDEFNVQNNTVQARLDKRRKQFHDLSVELGERLMPMAEHTISLASAFVRVLNVSIKFVAEYRTTILLLATAIGLLILQKKADILISKAEVIWNEKVAAAFKKLWAVVRANPYAAFATIAAVVVGLLLDHVMSANKASKALEGLNKVRDNAKVKMEEERGKLELLISASKDERLSLDERKRSINAIKAIVPGYIEQLDEETGKYKENKKALDDYLTSLAHKYELEGAKELLADLGNQIAKVRTEITKAENAAEDTKNMQSSLTKATGYNQAETMFLNQNTSQAEDHLKNANRRLDNLLKERKLIYDTYGVDLEKDAIKSAETVPDPDSPTFTPTDDSGKGDKKDPVEELKKQLKEQEDIRKAATDAELADNMLKYRAGEQDYRQFLANQQRIQEQGLQSRMQVWKDHSEQFPLEYNRLEKRLAALQLNGDEELNRLTEQQMDRRHVEKMAYIEAQFYEESAMSYQNVLAIDELLHQEDIRYLEEKKKLYREGSYERMEIEWEIEDKERQHQLDNQRTFNDLLLKYRDQYTRMAVDVREAVELDGLKRMYGHLKQQGQMFEAEYQGLISKVRAKYAKERADKAESELAVTESTTQKGLRSDRMREVMATAKKKTVENRDKREGESPSVSQFILGDIQQYADMFSVLKQMYDNNEISYSEMLQGMADVSGQMAGAIAERLQQAVNAVAPLMNAMNSYYSAQADYETAQVEKKYEKQIAAAGKNQVRQKKLEEKKEKEIAAIKTKYNRKQTKIQIAQALAQTAIGALNAYSSVWAGAPWPANQVLAPIAAAIATAAGLLQVAAIKKQAAAQEAGYYEGGYTGGNKYRREAGVVHEGEFVANHHAVNNPAITPMLDLIDRAQRNNTVGSLTAADVTRQLGQGASVVAPVVNVTTVNADMQESADQLSSAAQELHDRLSQPIPCYVVLDGPDGLMAQIKHLEKLKDI